MISSKENFLIAVLTLLVFLPSTTKASILIKTKCLPEKDEPRCVSLGNPQYLYIYDNIDADTYRRFMDAAMQVPINRPFPKIYLNSRGGDADYARQMGRILRLRSATVEGRDMISPENEPNCASACVDMAAGGVVRNFVQLQVHKGYIIKRLRGETYQYRPASQDDVSEARTYFNEMGIDPELGQLIDKTPGDDWTYIKYDKSKPLKDQQIYKLGFLMNEDIGKNLAEKLSGGEKDDWNAASAYRKLAEKGDAEAAYRMAHRYLYGIDGEEKDNSKAIYWFQRAGELGDAKGYHMLAVLYDQSPDVVKSDPQKSAEFYKKAAEMGFAGSQNNLAWAYYTGKGVTKNIPEAIYWATRSAEQGEPFAYSTLAQIRFDGNGFPEDDVETLKWSILAVEKLPEGNARQDLRQIQANLEKRMGAVDRKEAKKLASDWRPLKDSGFQMRDRSDE